MSNVIILFNFEKSKQILFWLLSFAGYSSAHTKSWSNVEYWEIKKTKCETLILRLIQYYNQKIECKDLLLKENIQFRKKRWK